MRVRHFGVLAGMVIIFIGLSVSVREAPRDARGGLKKLTLARVDSVNAAPVHTSVGSQRISSLNNSIPVAVDGSVTPEAIPDRVAYRHFIVAAGVPNAQDRHSAARQAIVVNSVGLSLPDRSVLVQSLNNVAGRLQQIDPATNPTDFKLYRDSILNAAEQEIRSTLTAEGAAKLERHVRQHLKPRIKIYGVVPQ